MAGRLTISLDPLPLKRVLAMEENGTEHLPPELSQEEKSLAILARIDFGQEAKKAKTEDGTKEKEEEAVQVWPWQGLVEHLNQAHQELIVILDLISHVEESEAVTVARMERPKLLQHETCSDLALRASSKLHHFRNVGKYLKRSAQALEHQVEREAVFYGALMRLQRNWKVKRQRGVAAGPGGSAGFSIDVGTSEAAPCVVIVDQDPAGLLVAHQSAGNSLASLHVTLHAKANIFQSEQRANGFSGPEATAAEERSDGAGSQDTSKSLDRSVGDGVDKGAITAQAVLRQIQTASFDEQVFEWVGREALLLSSALSVSGISDSYLQLNLGYATTVTLNLIPISPPVGESQGPVQDEIEEIDARKHSQISMPTNEASLGICFQQAYQQYMNDRHDQVHPKEAGKSKESQSEAAVLIKHLSATMRHRVACEKLLVVLERQVVGVPHLRLSSHPTWHAQVSAWDLWLDVPYSAMVDRWQANIVLREEILTIAGLPPGKGGNQAPVACTLSELSPFLLYQVAEHLVSWLYAEAICMGMEVRRNLLSITFELNSFEDVCLVASPSIKFHTINWSLRPACNSRLEDYGGFQAFLGPLSLESLRKIVIDLMADKLDSKLGGDGSVRGEAMTEPDRFARHPGS